MRRLPTPVQGPVRAGGAGREAPGHARGGTVIT